MNGSEQKKCCFCGNSVLGLMGPDIVLDTVYLQDDASDSEIINAGYFGDAHANCLAQRKNVQEFWAIRQAHNLVKTHGIALKEVREGVLAGRNERTSDFILLRQGSLLWIPYSAISRNVHDIPVLKLIEDVSWNLSRDSSFANHVAINFHSEGQIEIDTVLDVVCDPVSRPLYRSVINGHLRPYADDAEETFESLRHEVLSGEASYSFSILECEFEALNALLG